MMTAIGYFGMFGWDYTGSHYEQTLGEFLAYIREFNPPGKRITFRLIYRLRLSCKRCAAAFRRGKKLACNKVIYIRRKKNRKERRA
jgi:hypothetical protein